MTCEHCCGANEFFSSKEAISQMKKFRKKGATGVTKTLIELISKNIEGSTLLDIGGGIGAVQWHFHENKALSTTDIDASEGYLQVARDHATAYQWDDHSNFIKGDFVDMHREIPSFDYVVMDKVICCYPHFEELLTHAGSKCKKEFALTFPLGGLIPRVIFETTGLYFRLRKSSFRPYVHSPKKIHDVIVSGGFQLKKSAFKFPWYAKVYERVN